MYKIKSIAITIVVCLVSIISTGLSVRANPNPPTIILINPANGDREVAVNQKVEVTFNKPINPANISKETLFLTLEGSRKPILGRLTYSKKNRRISFNPKEPLASNTQYVVRVKGGANSGPNIRDLNDNRMRSDFMSSFRTDSSSTVSIPDSLQLIVSSTDPLNGDARVGTNSKVIAIFNEATNVAVNSNTVDFSLKQAGRDIPSSITYVGSTAVLNPERNLEANSTYTATITTHIPNLAAASNEYIWRFTTGQDSDEVLPVVENVSPALGSVNVATNSKISVNFSETVDPSTINTTTIVLKQGSTVIPGRLSYVGKTVVFIPTTNLTTNTTYTAMITTQVKDLAGNLLSTEYKWSFTTDQSQHAIVTLGAASNFAILAGSTVTNTGFTVISGDLGVSPGSAVTGFPPGSVINGIQHVNSILSNQAKLDLTTAYNDAAGRTLAPISVSGNLGGRTLIPGLYKSTSTLEISSGDLTLDAQGDSNAIFIFQIASTFDMASGRQIILSGAAKASNIFWQVGTSAIFGTASVVKGNILADQSITFMTGATLEGRALTRIAAIALDSNIITKP